MGVGPERRLSAEELMLSNCGVGEDYLPGAGRRHSAHGKGHEEGASTYAKVGLSLRSPHFTGGCPPPPLLEKELT